MCNHQPMNKVASKIVRDSPLKARKTPSIPSIPLSKTMENHVESVAQPSFISSMFKSHIVDPIAIQTSAFSLLFHNTQISIQTWANAKNGQKATERLKIVNYSRYGSSGLSHYLLSYPTTTIC